jgi:hypothetical protein
VQQLREATCRSWGFPLERTVVPLYKIQVLLKGRMSMSTQPILLGGRWGGRQSKSHTGLTVLALTCKILGSHTFHPYNKKKAEQTEKSRDVSWTHQKIEVTGQTTTPQSRET